MTKRIEATMRGDIFGGLTAAVVALPLAIAFGVVAFAPLGVEYASTGALVGLLGAIFTGLFAAFFGGTPSQVTGPTGPMTVVSTAVLAAVAQAHVGDLPTIMVLLAMAIVAAGIFQILLGLIGAGSIIRFIPYPVVAGFMNGIAIIIFISQLKPFFGITGAWSTFSLGHAWVPMVVGTITVISILVSGRISKAIPGALVGLVVGIVVYLVLAVAGAAPFTTESNTMLVGTVPNPFASFEQMNSMMPVFNFGSLLNITSADLNMVLMGGLALSVLGAIDSLLTSLVADKVTKTRHNSRKELIGQGIGNIASGLVGGLAGAGATVRTLVNVNAGGRSKRSGMLHSLVLITVVVALGVPAGWIPLSALAGILFVTAVSMVDYYSVALVKRKKVLYEFSVMAIVAAVTVLVDLMVAVAVGCGIALLFYVWKQIRVPVIRRRLRGNEMFSRCVRNAEEQVVLAHEGKNTLIYELSNSLFFGNAEQFSREAESDIGSAKRVVFDFSKVTHVDLSGIQVLLELMSELHEEKIQVYICGLIGNDQKIHGLSEILVELDVVNKIGSNNVFNTLDIVLESIEEEILQNDTVIAGDELGKIPVMTNEDEESIVSTILTNEAIQEAGFLKHVTLQPGEKLFNSGDPADDIALVNGGRLSVVQPTISGEKRMASVGKGSILGIRTLFDGVKINNSVCAEVESDVYLISRKNLEQLSESNPKLMTGLMKKMLQSSLERLDLLTRQVAHAEAH